METGVLVVGILGLLAVVAVVASVLRRGSTRGRILVEWSKEEGPSGSNSGPTFRPKPSPDPDGPETLPPPPAQQVPGETGDPDHPDGPS